MLTLLNIQDLSQTAIELSETILILLIQEDSLDVAIVMQSLIELVEQISLHVAAFHFRSTTVSVIQSHDQHRRSIRVACRLARHLSGCQHLK